MTLEKWFRWPKRPQEHFSISLTSFSRHGPDRAMTLVGLENNGRSLHANRPWQCLNFFPEPHGQTSLRPTLPQVAGSLGSRATAVLTLAPALRAKIGRAHV